MYEFWYDHEIPKYGENANFCYMDTDSFIVHAQMIFTKTLQKMLEHSLILKILNQAEYIAENKNLKK